MRTRGGPGITNIRQSRERKKNMKKWKFAWALGLGLGLAGWCRAEYAEEGAEGDLEKPRDPIQVSLSLRAATIQHSHDALQHRADYTDDTRQHWQNGETDGDGWGMTLSVRQDAAELTLRRESLDHTFLAAGDPNSRHEVQTQRDDWEILYWQTETGRDEIGEKGARGWQAGIRYIGSRKEIEIQERSARLEEDGNVTWKLLQGGYWGAYRPMGWNARLFGALHFLFGEVDGLSRHGNDDELDGKISETYREDQGLAYGMGLTLGAGLNFLKYCHINLGYRREWLYSFQATDSGVVVFPDNDDALFIENISMIFAELGLSYRF